MTNPSIPAIHADGESAGPASIESTASLPSEPNKPIVGEPATEASAEPERNVSGEPVESFSEILRQYDRTHSRRAEDGGKTLQGTVIAVTADSVFVDIGFKTEGVLPLSAFQTELERIGQKEDGEAVKAGDTLPVTVKGRNEEGYYELSRLKVEQPKDWTSLEQAFVEKSIIAGTVTGVVKGGLTVDVGVRAFMPSSRSGARDAEAMEKLVGQEIRCRIIKLEVEEEDVVVDRRAVVEEEARSARDQRYGELKEGDTVQGTVRSLMDYGAFIDVGGVDGLLHISDMAWGRVNKPADVLTVGQRIEARVLKVEAAGQRVSLGLKQLQPHPWDAVAAKYSAGDRVRGTVTRLADFGAFVELEPGIEGLIHLSEMSWAKKVRKPGDLLKPGETVETVILGVSAGERRISLGLKQALGDPWADAGQRFAVGSVVEGPVTSFTKFGAFVQLAKGVEGMIHISEISAGKRLDHPQDVLRAGQVVKAQVLELDKEKRQLRLSMKQLVPTSLDEFIAEHKEGDLVTGRLIDVSGSRTGGGQVRVELGEGVEATFGATLEKPVAEEAKAEGSPALAAVDLSALSSMLKARWKGGPAPGPAKQETMQAGQIRSFRIIKLDEAAKKIEVELV